VSETEVSVVICAYTAERWDDLVAAVDSLRVQTHLPLEVVVVVDYNTALLERVRARIDGVAAVANVFTRGLGGGRNTGISIAKGEVIAFLDDDAVAEPNWLEQLLAGYGDPSVIGTGGAPRPLWAGGPPRWFPDEFAWVVGCAYEGLPTSAAAVRNLFGSNMSFRRSTFASLGGFRLGYGCDETEFCIRVHQRWPHAIFLYIPTATVHHRVRANRGSWSYFLSRCFFEGQSKAVVSSLVGVRDGLAAERAYTTRTLPRGVARGLAHAVRERDWYGLARAAAIVAGLGATGAGYLAGRVRLADAARKRGYVPLERPIT
jgi:glycosyltransferase involved in cell wall biosynthesis